MISIKNLEAAAPLARRLKHFQQALRVMVDAPARLSVDVRFPDQAQEFVDLTLDYDTARAVLGQEIARLVRELDDLGVQV